MRTNTVQYSNDNTCSIKKNNTREAQKALVYIKTTTKKRNINPKSSNKNKNKQIKKN